MSALAVIYDRRKNAVDNKTFDRIFSKLDYRGVDGRNTAYQGPVVIGHQHFWTTPEEIGEEQPLRNSQSNITLAFDGRIDNREELKGLIKSKDIPGDISDAALVLELFLIYGDKIFEKIIGPFLAVIYDEAGKELLLIRDPVGDRTIYYYSDENTFVASSEEHSLLEHPSVSAELNEKSIVKLLILSSLPDYDQTFFRDIRELPPAHKLKITGAKIDISRYWNFKKNRDQIKGIEELSHEYFLLLENSVKGCLRSVYEPAVMMSGGIDSTTVAYIASNNMESAGFNTPLTTISGVFNDLSNCDESRFIDDLAGRADINSIKIPCDDAYPLSDEKKFFNNPNTPYDDLFRILTERVYSTALGRNNRVILSGHFADDLYFKGHYDYLLDLLKYGKFLEFFINSLILIKRDGVIKFTRNPAVRRLFGFYHNIFGNRQPKIPEHIKPNDNVAEMIDKIPDNKIIYSYLNLNSTKLSAYENVNANIMNEEIRFPYRNRRLIEFINSLPAYFLYNHGTRKVILKKALDHRLPESIIKRNDNISLSDLSDKGLVRISEFLSKNSAKQPQLWNKYLSEHTFSENNKPGANNILSYNFLKWCSVSLELWKRRYNYM